MTHKRKFPWIEKYINRRNFSRSSRDCENIFINHFQQISKACTKKREEKITYILEQILSLVAWYQTENTQQDILDGMPLEQADRRKIYFIIMSVTLFSDFIHTQKYTYRRRQPFNKTQKQNTHKLRVKILVHCEIWFILLIVIAGARLYFIVLETDFEDYTMAQRHSRVITGVRIRLSSFVF